MHLRNPVHATCSVIISQQTPLKMNMEWESTNHPFSKEHDLPDLHDYFPCESSGV